jgi:hypothetical protein
MAMASQRIAAGSGADVAGDHTGCWTFEACQFELGTNCGREGSFFVFIPDYSGLFRRQLDARDMRKPNWVLSLRWEVTSERERRTIEAGKMGAAEFTSENRELVEGEDEMENKIFTTEGTEITKSKYEK